MTLPVISDTQGIPGQWDWKAAYLERLADGSGMELFSEASVTPDTMLFLAGPPRVAAEGFEQALSPIGLVQNVQVSTDNQLQPHWEIGTDQTYFTRGKAIHTMQIGAMVANKPSLMKILTRQSPTDTEDFPKDQAKQFWVNLDSETLSKPFGVLVLFKSKGGQKDAMGTPIGSVYLENCNIGSFSWGISAQDLVLQENLTIMFDRMISVEYS